MYGYGARRVCLCPPQPTVYAHHHHATVAYIESSTAHACEMIATAHSCPTHGPRPAGLVDIIVWEAVRSDYFSMIIHHISTLSLLFGSFYFGCAQRLPALASRFPHNTRHSLPTAAPLVVLLTPPIPQLTLRAVSSASAPSS